MKSKMSEIKSISVILLLFILGIFPLISSASISVTPSLLELKIPPGKSFTDAILVTNVGSSRVNVIVYLSDFQLNAEGNIAFSEAGTDMYSLVSCLRVNPTSFSLEPKEEKWIRFTITTPEDVTGELHGIIFFHTQSSQLKRIEDKKVLVSARIGTTIYAASKTTIAPSSEITDILIKQDPMDSTFYYSIIYHNNGNIHLRPQGRLKILDSTGKTLTETVLNENNSSVLRNSIRIFSGKFNSKIQIRTGIYYAQVQFNYDEKTIEAEKKVYISNQAIIETHSVTLSTPETENQTYTAYFKASISGVKAREKFEGKETLFRLKNLEGHILAEIPAEVSLENTLTQRYEFTGQWSGILKPGIYYSEFLFILSPEKPISSFTKIVVDT